MRKKDKRKKSDRELLNAPDSSTERKEYTNDGHSASRSRSRQRRSLSSLFKRSGSRPRSEDRRKEADRNDEADKAEEEVNNEANPRTNPRDHLKRMTVREALVYDRRRGRSPNRRALRLEKKVLNKELNNEMNNEHSASLPYLSDNPPVEDQTVVQEVTSSSVEGRSGSTLPRSKRKNRRSILDSDSAQNHSQTLFGSNISTNQFLPLDKRKYLINIDHNNSTGRNDSIAKIDHHMTPTLEHSKLSLDLHNSDKTLTDSHNHFSKLNEQRSPLTFSPVDVPDSTPLLSRSPQERESSSSKNDSTPSVLDHNVFSFMTNKRPSVQSERNRRESIIPASEPVPTDRERNAKRTSYVSPRRFSRATRPSVTSFKSDVSDNSVFSNAPEVKSAYTTTSGNQRVKYQRHFSRERKKTPSDKDKHPAVNDAATEPLPLMSGITTSTITEPQKMDASTSMGDISFMSRNSSTSSSQVQTDATNNKDIETKINDDIIEHESAKDDETSFKPLIESEIQFIDENKQELENNPPLSPILREVVVIDNNATLPDMSDNDHERVFRPIQSDNSLSENMLPKLVCPDEILGEEKPENDHENLISAEIQEKPIEPEENSNNKSSKPKKYSKFSIKRRKSKGKKNENKEEQHNETKEKEKEFVEPKKLKPGKSKKEKKKNKKQNNVSIEISQYENNAQAGASENEPSDQINNKSLKKRKSILKKSSNDSLKQLGKTKPLKRTSSMSKFLDPNECQRHEERRQSLTLVGKRSQSLDNITIEKDKMANSNKRVSLKDNKVKVKDETVVDKAAKTSKPAPKLSLVAIIAMRAKISRMKKARQAREANKKLHSEENDSNSVTPNVTSNSNTENETESSDLSVAKVFYENEINTSIGKSDTSIEIIEDTDKEVKDIVFEKQVQFSQFCDDTMTEEEMIKQRQRNTRLTSRRESKVRQRQKKVISCCKKFVAFLFSHIGLCSVVVAYCILGGVIFKALEGESEIEKKKEIREITQNFTEEIYRLAFEKSQTKGNRENFKSDVNEILKKFSVVIHKQTKEAGWDGKEIRLNPDRKVGEPEAEPEQWSYPSSLLYAITVMTTIGYGHVAPKTDEGRIATIAYAVLGIPLTLLCLTNIGDVMAHGFRMLYGKVCCGVCCILFRPRRRRRLDPEKGISAGEERLIMQENEKSGEVIHVPTSVCLLLMSSYIMLGTILFAKWEGWDMVTGTYFCFITLSTIGFGDVVPGMSSQAWTDQNEKLVSCALYLVFGLSLIAMCFNLVQEDVKDKCKRLGKKLGIIDK